MNKGIMTQALEDFLSSEKYKEIKKQDLANHKKYIELKFGKPFADKVELIIDRNLPEGQTFLVNSKALDEYVRKPLEEHSHNPQSPETVNEVASHKPEIKE